MSQTVIWVIFSLRAQVNSYPVSELDLGAGLNQLKCSGFMWSPVKSDLWHKHSGHCAVFTDVNTHVVCHRIKHSLYTYTRHLTAQIIPLTGGPLTLISLLMRHGRMAQFPLVWKTSENELSVSLAQSFIISAWEEKEREKE